MASLKMFRLRFGGLIKASLVPILFPLTTGAAWDGRRVFSDQPFKN